MRLFVHLCVVTSLLTATGCESKPEPVVAPGVPLEHDPTDKYELAEWWVGDDRLLHLDPTHAYRLYGSLNRYDPPIERGRWDHGSYAVLWLEPYLELELQHKRIPIARQHGELVVLLEDSVVLRPTVHPPHVPEDELLGLWQSTAGALRLRDDLTYEYRPSSVQRSTPVMLSGHQGVWELMDDRLRLLPDPPGLGPFELKMTSEQGDVHLASPDGAFERVEGDGVSNVL